MSDLPHETNRIYVLPKDPQVLDLRFLFYYISHVFGQGAFERVARGSTKKSIRVGDVREMPLVGILEGEVAVGQRAGSRRRRRPTTRPAKLGDITQVTTRRPKRLEDSVILQRVCDPDGTNCGRPYIVIGTAPLYVRSAPARNPSWRDRAQQAMYQGRIAFERMQRGAEQTASDIRRGARAAGEFAEQERLRRIVDQIRGTARSIVYQARLIGVDQEQLVEQLTRDTVSALESSGYQISISDIANYMRDEVGKIESEIFNRRWDVRYSQVPGQSFTRARYGDPEVRGRADFTGGRRQPTVYVGAPQPRVQAGWQPAGQSRQDRRQEYRRAQERRKQEQARAHAEQEHQRARDAIQELASVLSIWGLGAIPGPAEADGVFKRLSRHARKTFHPDQYARSGQSEQERMTRVFTAANEDLENLAKFVLDPASADFSYRRDPAYRELDMALQASPPPGFQR